MAARASASEPAPAALRLAPFLVLTLAFPAAAVAGNFVLASLTPTTIWIQDEFTFFDAAWRVVKELPAGGVA